LPSKADIKKRALELGFDLVGIAPLGPFKESQFYSEWIAQGYAGEMQYLERQQQAKLDPQSVLSGAKSVIVCAVNYNTDRPYTSFNRLRAWISRYAWGEDYHDRIQQKLKDLAAWIEQSPGHHTKAYVDTGPLLERVYAKYAGIGWFGKNTCMINQRVGSMLFLGCILTNEQFDYDSPAPDRCGTCTRCIDACPTKAIVAPYVLDSRKCIAYSTIELRGEIPEFHRDEIGHHLFGCDICQDVCPWNRKAPFSDKPEFASRPGLFWPEIDGLLELSDEDWSRMVRGTSMKRAKVKGLLRNLMVVVGNSGVRDFVPKLERFLAHSDAHVRTHAEWAIKKLRGS
jgi:epoxyqueuosine reductase